MAPGVFVFFDAELRGIEVWRNKEPEVRERLLTLSFTAAGGTPDELDARIKSETVKWKKVIEAAGLKPE